MTSSSSRRGRRRPRPARSKPAKENEAANNNVTAPHSQATVAAATAAAAKNKAHNVLNNNGVKAALAPSSAAHLHHGEDGPVRVRSNTNRVEKTKMSDEEVITELRRIVNPGNPLEQGGESDRGRRLRYRVHCAAERHEGGGRREAHGVQVAAQEGDARHRDQGDAAVQASEPRQLPRLVPGGGGRSVGGDGLPGGRQSDRRRRQDGAGRGPDRGGTERMPQGTPLPAQALLMLTNLVLVMVMAMVVMRQNKAITQCGICCAFWTAFAYFVILAYNSMDDPLALSAGRTCLTVIILTLVELATLTVYFVLRFIRYKKVVELYNCRACT